MIYVQGTTLYFYFMYQGTKFTKSHMIGFNLLYIYIFSIILYQIFDRIQSLKLTLHVMT